VSRLLTQIHPGQGKKRRSYAALIDLQKAYDTVNREKLWRILDSRCRNETDGMLALLMVKMYQKSQVVIGKHSFSADLGVVQGGVLSPMLFNVYLEEALGTTDKLKEMVRRGDLLAFADDMLILTNSKAEMTQAI
jgi:RNA-directed DNA polymerase